jgi:pyruvate formate-lyase activating enzyme-like uncharacterized protein
MILEKLPFPLRSIYAEVNQPQRLKPNLDTLKPGWEEYLSRASQIPGVQVEAGGEIVYLRGLSPGCLACKQGTWDCIFVTNRCNLSCAFCYSPYNTTEADTDSVFGSTLEQIIANHRRTHITGIAFTGGEPFLQPARLFEWLNSFKINCPDHYYWVYTNGLLANSENLQRLRELGVNEIRFNTAATGYDHPTVMKNLEQASRLIPYVTIEIPAIPEHTDKVLSCLALWSSLGAQFLNLHELMYEPGTKAASMSGPRQAVITADGHYTEINSQSRELTLSIMRKVSEANISFAVNDCSLQSKLRQLRVRRRNLSPITKLSHERMIGDEFFETCCAYKEEQYCFFHPDLLPVMRQSSPDYQYIRLIRIAPLALTDVGRWVAFDEI